MVVEHKVEYGFSAKLIDYMQAGKPILLASEAEYNLPESLFKRSKPKSKDIAEAINQLSELPQERMAKTGKDIKNFALENFNMQKNYDLLIEPFLYRIG
jgi:hypothetical protein